MTPDNAKGISKPAGPRPAFELIPPNSPRRGHDPEPARWVIRRIMPVRTGYGQWYFGYRWRDVLVSARTRSEAILRFEIEYPGERLYSLGDGVRTGIYAPVETELDRLYDHLVPEDAS